MVESRGLALVREVPPGYLAHYVVDASVALKWIVTEDLAEEARQYARGAVDGRLRLSVPSLFWYEVANALRYSRDEQFSSGARTEPWEIFRTVPLHTMEFTPDAFSLMAALALRYNITVYDAAYVFLAQTLQVPLITADQRLADRCRSLPYVWRLGAAFA